MRLWRRGRAEPLVAESVLRLTRERDAALDRAADLDAVVDAVILAAAVEDPVMREVELLAAVAALETAVGRHAVQR